MPRHAHRVLHSVLSVINWRQSWSHWQHFWWSTCRGEMLLTISEWWTKFQREVQRVLHVAARMVLNLRPYDHVTPALLELHWLPIAERIDFKLCLLVHKALVGHAPQYIVDLIRPVAYLPSRASLWTALSGDLYVPRTRRRFGDRAFAVAAKSVWHSLLTDIKLHQSTTTSFKRCLKTVLFNRGFTEYM